MRIDGRQYQHATITINGVPLDVRSICYSVDPSSSSSVFVVGAQRGEGTMLLEMTPETRDFLARLRSWTAESGRKAKRRARMARKRRRGWA